MCSRRAGRTTPGDDDLIEEANEIANGTGTLRIPKIGVTRTMRRVCQAVPCSFRRRWPTISAGRTSPFSHVSEAFLRQLLIVEEALKLPRRRSRQVNGENVSAAVDADYGLGFHFRAHVALRCSRVAVVVTAAAAATAAFAAAAAVLEFLTLALTALKRSDRRIDALCIIVARLVFLHFINMTKRKKQQTTEAARAAQDEAGVLDYEHIREEIACRSNAVKFWPHCCCARTTRLGVGSRSCLPRLTHRAIYFASTLAGRLQLTCECTDAQMFVEL